MNRLIMPQEPQLKQTREYRLFETDRTNRSLRKLTKLLASMRQWGFLPGHPIAVIPSGSKMVIRDGQHRFSAAKELKLPVWYICSDCYADVSIPEVNSAGAGAWTIKDYIESHYNRGNPEYAKLKSFIEEHKLQPAISAALLAGRATGDEGISQQVRDGKFTVRQEADALDVVRVVKVAGDHVKWARSREFVGALASALRVAAVSADELCEKIRKNPSLLTQQPTQEAYLTMFEEMVNYRQKNRVPLKFLAEQCAKKRPLNGVNFNGSGTPA